MLYPGITSMVGADTEVGRIVHGVLWRLEAALRSRSLSFLSLHVLQQRFSTQTSFASILNATSFTSIYL